MMQKRGSITFGEEVKKFEVEGFTLTQTFHSPHLVLPRHDHECANINFNFKGYFREIINSRPQESKPSSLLIKPAGESHANQYGDAGAHCLVIEVLPRKLAVIQKSSGLFDAPAHIRGGALTTIAKKIYKEFQMMHSDDTASDLMIEGLMLEMLAEATRQNIRASSSGIPPYWLRVVRNFIHENFLERISLSKVAESVSVNPAHVARMFRKHYGCTIGDYARRLKIEFAVRELAETDLSLVEISSSAGFCDQSHFTNAFKIYIGMTPAEFRAMYRQTGRFDTKKS